MQYTQKELTKLLADVEKEFTTHLAKAEENFRLAKSEGESAASSVDGTETLAKAEDDSAEAKDKKEDKKSEAPAKEESKDESKEESKEAPAAEAKDEEAPAAPAAEQPADEAAAAPAAEGHGYDAEDLEHMRQMYASMSFEELMAHHDAVKECLDAMAAQQAPAADAAPAPEAPAAEAAAPAAEAAPIDKCGDMAIAKSEDMSVELVKSELAAEKAKSEELKKSLDAVSEFLTKLVTKKAAPAAKAITSVETIAKSEGAIEEKTLSKSEITAILTKKAGDPKLSKSDREAINAYYGSGQVGIEKISHLLK